MICLTTIPSKQGAVSGQKKNASVFLTQCDTTAGLLGREAQVLNALKGRPINQPILIESPSLAALKTLVRVPKAHRSRLRRAKYTSFIYPNGKAVRLTSPL